MPDRSRITRDINAGDSLEMMLVFAVVTIIGIRGFLALTGYPQLGGGGLHIAHMLWGGLGMLVSIWLLLSFWNTGVRQLAAAIGGIGFGFFIDELGKFITSDNDYFFRPTFALLYVLFVFLFLVINALHGRPLTTSEKEANERIQAAMTWQDRSVVARAYDAIEHRFSDAYTRLVRTSWFTHAVSIGFIVVAIGQIAGVVVLATSGAAPATPDESIPLLQRAAAAASSVFIVIGVVVLPRSRLRAYRWFLRSTLITIFVTQVFTFYYSELAALGGLSIHLLIYFALRQLITREEELQTAPAPATA